MTLKEASRWLESELGLKRSPAALFGWLYYGRLGCKLECVSVAGKWHTTAGAIRRFLEACTEEHSRQSGCGANVMHV